MEVKSRTELDKLVKKRQAERKEVFEKLKNEYKLDADAEAIVELDDDTLISRLQSRSLKALDVLKAFIAKMVAVNEHCNCVTDFNPKSLEWAKELDELPNVKGPLHGLPIGIKEDFDVEGMDTTLAYAKFLYSPKKETSVFVRVLQDLGAVPFVKTNVPQSLFAFACDNCIWGKTLNPKNTKLAPGGSSGGSGAIVAARGAVFATGSDIGGSLRIPTHFNGVATVRPTRHRFSGKGIMQCVPKLIGFWGVPGIIAKNPKTLTLVLSEMLKENRQNKLDPLTHPIPWDETLFSSTNKLRVGYYVHLPFFPCMGSTEQTVEDAKSALESLGHSVVPFKMPDDFKYMQLINSLLFADGGRSIREFLVNEEVAGAIKGLATACSTPEWKRKLQASLQGLPLMGQGLVGASKRLQLMSKCELDARNSEDLWDKMYERQQIIDELLDKMDEANLDVILCPAFPFAAIRVDDAAQLLYSVVYTMIWNLVEFPAGIVRFGTEAGDKIESYNDEGDAMLRLAKESYKESAGMPIGVQIVARPYKEELVLRVMNELGNISKN